MEEVPALYVFVGGPRHGETTSSLDEPLAQWSTEHGRYVADELPQIAPIATGTAIVLWFAPKVA